MRGAFREIGALHGIRLKIVELFDPGFWSQPMNGMQLLKFLVLNLLRR